MNASGGDCRAWSRADSLSPSGQCGGFEFREEVLMALKKIKTALLAGATVARRLCRSPAGRKRVVGCWSAGNEARKRSCQRAQISGEVMTKVLGDLPGVSLRRRWWRVRRRPGAMVTS